MIGHGYRAREELAAIEALQRELPDTTLPYWREEVQVHRDAVRFWILLAERHESAAHCERRSGGRARMNGSFSRRSDT